MIAGKKVTDFLKYISQNTCWKFIQKICHNLKVNIWLELAKNTISTSYVIHTLLKTSNYIVSYMRRIEMRI